RTNPGGDAMSAAHVERPYSGGEAVHAFVGERDRLVLTIERQHAENRPEDFFAHDPSVFPDAGHDGRPHEVSAWSLPGTGACERHALARRLVEEAANLLELSGVGEWPHLGCRVARVTHFDRLSPSDDPSHELVVDGAVNDQPRAGDAGLARRGKDARDYAVR